MATAPDPVNSLNWEAWPIIVVTNSAPLCIMHGCWTPWELTPGLHGKEEIKAYSWRFMESAQLRLAPSTAVKHNPELN